jgi:predicted ATP-dependent endonuclease of OLD family
MNEPIKYISKVEIKNLWGRYDIEWKLDPSVNILSGINGSGKSTVLDCIANTAFNTALLDIVDKKMDYTIVTFNNSFIKNSKGLTIIPRKEFSYTSNMDNEILKDVKFHIITNFDINLNQYESPNEKVKTELDKMIFQLQKYYLDYQLNIGKKAFEIVSKNGENDFQEVLELKKMHNRFLEIIDSLFAETGKKVDRNNNELMFLNGKQKLEPYQLSSGEKQLLIILMTVLIQDSRHFVLFMDEPEVSLHVDWQRKLIQYIKELNPNVQIILATHSPGIILEGWSDKVFEMSDLITLDRQAKLENAK